MLLTNASAQTALRSLREADSAVDQVQMRIASGLKVASAKDNAAYFLVSMTQRSDNIALRGIRDNLNYAIGAVKTAMAAQPSLSNIIDNITDAVVMLETGAAETEITKTIQTQVREAFNIITGTSYNGVNLLEKQQIETFVLGYRRDQYGGLAFDTTSIQGAGLGIRPPTVSSVATPLPGAIMDFNSTALTGSPGNLNPTLPPNIPGVNIGNNATGGLSERTFAISFETGNDVTREQVIYEEGGNVRGLNISIRNGQLVFGGYNLQNSDPGSPWPYKEVQLGVAANTRYTAQLVFDGNTSNTGSFRAYLDGTLIDQADGVGILYDHPGAIGIGQIAGNAVVNGTVKNDDPDPTTGNRFEGLIDKVVAYNRFFTADEFDVITTYLAEGWLPPKSVSYYVGSELRLRDASLIELLDAVAKVDLAGFSTDNALKVLDAAREKMNYAFSTIGAMEKRLVRQQEFLTGVTSATDEGIASLVEADLQEESARIQSFQVRADLARQSLLIANRQPETLLSLFR